MTDINIYSPGGAVRLRAHIGTGSKRYFTLMEADYVSLKFTIDRPIVLHTGDYILIPIKTPIEGSNGGFKDGYLRYELLAPYKPERDYASNGYNYQPQFEAQYRKFSNKLMKFIPQVGASETSWTVTYNIIGHATQILNNMNMLSHSFRGEKKYIVTQENKAIQIKLRDAEAVLYAEKNDSYLYNGSDVWEVSIDPVNVSAKYVTMTYNSTNILDAISQLAEQYECDWWFEDNVLHFGKCQYGDEPVEISEDVEYTYDGKTQKGNLCKSSRTNSKENKATRLYVYGSDRNLPSTYRKRLVFTAYMDGLYFSDVARPLKGEWFPKSLLHEKGTDRTAPLGVTHTEPLGTYGSSYNKEFDEFYLHKIEEPSEVEDLIPADNYIMSFSHFKPKLAIGVASGECPTKATATLTVYTKEEGQFATFKTWKTFTSELNIVGNGLGNFEGEFSFTDEKYEPKKSLSGIKFKFGVSVKTNPGSTLSITINGTGQWVTLADRYPIYYTDDVLTVQVVDRKTGGVARTISSVAFNTLFDKENPKFLLPNGLSESEMLKEGDLYTIAELNEALVPASYFTNKYTILEKYAHLTTNGIVTNRLLLPEDDYPNGYVDVIPIESEEEAIEDVVVFEDVYPQRLSYVTDVKTDTLYQDQPEMDGSTTRKPYPAYSIRDDHFNEDNPFNNTYLIPYKSLQIQFQGVLTYRDLQYASHPEDLPEGKTLDSPVYDNGNNGGKLTGMTFDVDYLSTNRFFIKRNDSINVPDEYLRPMKGDTYILTGFNVAMIADVDADYIGNAERMLATKAHEYIEELNTDANTYNCTIACDWAKMMCERFGNGLCFGLGQKVNLINPAYFENGRISRIIGWEVPLDVPYDNPVYIVGEKAKYSRLGEIQNDLTALQIRSDAMLSGVTISPTDTAGGVYLIKNNDTTQPRDTNAYSALRASRELTERALSKVSADRTPHRLSTDTAFEVGRFVPGAGGGIFSVDTNGESYIEADRLRVRKTASFEELEISKVTSVGGKQIVTPGGGATIASVSEIYNMGSLYAYKCYLVSSDGETNVSSAFREGDLIYCKTFNLVDENNNQVNRYYWRQCVGKGRDYILLSVLCDSGSDAPAAGDNIVQLGAISDTQRQSAIVIDTVGGDQPSITLLSGINSFTMANKESIIMGVRREDSVPYLNVYGDCYVGTHDQRTYIKYTSTGDADNPPTLEIKAKINASSTIGNQSLYEFVNGGSEGDKTETIIQDGLVTTGSLVVADANDEEKGGLAGGGGYGNIRIWAGSSKDDRATAPFRVDHEGVMYAQNARIKGTIVADGLVLGPGSAIVAINGASKSALLPKLNEGTVQTVEAWVHSLSDEIYFETEDETVGVGENVGASNAFEAYRTYRLSEPGLYRLVGICVGGTTLWNIIRENKAYNNPTNPEKPNQGGYNPGGGLGGGPNTFTDTISGDFIRIENP